MIATKDRAHLCCGQHDRNRQTASHGADLPAPTFRPIECDEEQRGFSVTRGVADLLEASNRETSPAGETDHVAATLYQKSLDAIRKPRRRGYGPARRAYEKPSRYRDLKYVPARGQPQTPPG